MFRSLEFLVRYPVSSTTSSQVDFGVTPSQVLSFVQKTSSLNELDQEYVDMLVCMECFASVAAGSDISGCSDANTNQKNSGDSLGNLKSCRSNEKMDTEAVCESISRNHGIEKLSGKLDDAIIQENRTPMYSSVGVE